MVIKSENSKENPTNWRSPKKKEGSKWVKAIPEIKPYGRGHSSKQEPAFLICREGVCLCRNTKGKDSLDREREKRKGKKLLCAPSLSLSLSVASSMIRNYFRDQSLLLSPLTYKSRNS
jgi:hypothetical protein